MAKKADNPIGDGVAALLGGVVGAALGAGGVYVAMRQNPTRALPASPGSIQSGHRYVVTVTVEGTLPASMTAASIQASLQSTLASMGAAAPLKLVSVTSTSNEIVITVDVTGVLPATTPQIGGFCVSITDSGVTPP